jgi:hypothetical protein
MTKTTGWIVNYSTVLKGSKGRSTINKMGYTRQYSTVQYSTVDK